MPDVQVDAPPVSICVRLKAEKKARLDRAFDAMADGDRALLVGFAELMLRPQVNDLNIWDHQEITMQSVLKALERFLISA